MLPFLKAKKRDTTMMAASPEGELESQMPPNESMTAIAEDILSAIAGKDATRLAIALHAAYEVCMMDEGMEDEGKL